MRLWLGQSVGCFGLFRGNIEEAVLNKQLSDASAVVIGVTIVVIDVSLGEEAEMVDAHLHGVGVRLYEQQCTKSSKS